jgi:hypothetical protein
LALLEQTYIPKFGKTQELKRLNFKTLIIFTGQGRHLQRRSGHTGCGLRLIFHKRLEDVETVKIG